MAEVNLHCELPLEDGSHVVLRDDRRECHTEHDKRWNIWRIAPSGATLWQVKVRQEDLTTVDSDDGFVRMRLVDGHLIGYTFYGGVYGIDLATGVATYLRWEKN